MKFKEGDNLSWDLFLEACKEVDEKCKKHLNESNQMPTSFSSIKTTGEGTLYSLSKCNGCLGLFCINIPPFKHKEETEILNKD